MTPDDVEKQLVQIREHVRRKDHEAASQVERDLWLDVLQHIADAKRGCPDLRKLARVAVQSKRIEFYRW